MGSLLQVTAVLLWLYADIVIKLLFLFMLIWACHRGASMPKPHRWLWKNTAGRIRKVMSRSRMLKYPCCKCTRYVRGTLWDEVPPVCAKCRVHNWFLWRRPSGWIKKVGRDGLIA